jgi:hypothetical protein
MKRPKPSPALRRGQQRSRRVQLAREHYEAALGLLCRRGHAELITDGVSDSRLTRVLIGLSIEAATADDVHVEYVARDPRNLIQWARRHPQRVAEILAEHSQMKSPSASAHDEGQVSINMMKGPIDNEHSRRMCGQRQASI